MTQTPQVEPAFYVHRDVSWLHFNERVLAECHDGKNPLFERMKFLAITSSNLDEFFMVRLALLNRSVLGAQRTRKEESAIGLAKVRTELLKSVVRFQQRQSDTFVKLAKDLAMHGVHLHTFYKGPKLDRKIAQEIFRSKVLPELGAPTLFNIKNVGSLKNLQMAAFLGEKMWVEVPKSLPQVYWERDAQGKVHAFFLDHLLKLFLNESFQLATEPAIFRLTRDSYYELSLDEADPETIPDVVRSEIGARDEGRPIRLQHLGPLSDMWKTKAASSLKISQAQVVQAPKTLCLAGLWPFVRQMRDLLGEPKLFFPPLVPRLPKEFEDPSTLFERIREQDRLLHHPYDSFDAFAAFIGEACRDPNVTAIEQTVYRTDAQSPIIDALKEAAKRKKIRVAIELRARFDEQNNLRLAEELRAAGVEVVFGFGKLKMHAKIALVTRTEEGKSRYYTHLSTGNYNATTARQYTDIAILSAKQEIGEDAKRFFDFVAKGQVCTDYKVLVSAPAKLHKKILQEIDSEIQSAKAGGVARIFAKCNALVDEGVIEKLYEASRAGVKIDLVVRGACSLVPGVKGQSENIRVISIVGRFLEHSRIYSFASSRMIYLSSADWMPRNFFSRLELAFPVTDPKLYEIIAEKIIPAYLKDNQKAHEMTAKGTWRKRTKGASEELFSCQEFFLSGAV